jgi:ABC-type transport system involved in cytochrome bd biosynthesis fused ATPase/permease subunit
MTIIVIAHRLSTIRDADKICVLFKGVLTEMGNHETLLANYPNGTYADFCAKQKSSEEKPTTESGTKVNETTAGKNSEEKKKES